MVLLPNQSNGARDGVVRCQFWHCFIPTFSWAALSTISIYVEITKSGKRGYEPSMPRSEGHRAPSFLYDSDVVQTYLQESFLDSSTASTLRAWTALLK